MSNNNSTMKNFVKKFDFNKKIKKFENFKIEQNKKIQIEKLKEENEKKKELNFNIKNERNKNQRFHCFLQQFEEKGIKNWKKNMIKRKENELKEIKFQLEKAKKIKNNLQNEINKNIKNYKNEINEFEKNFNEKISNENYFFSNDLNNLQNKNLYESIENRSRKITEKIYNKMMNTKTKMERNQRRQKIIEEQEKNQIAIENKIKEEQFINKIK